MQDVAQLPAVQIVRNAGPGALAGGQGAAEEALWAQVGEEPRQARVVAGHGFDRSHEVGALSGGDELEPLAAQQVEGPEPFDGGIGPHSPGRARVAGVPAGAGATCLSPHPCDGQVARAPWLAQVGTSEVDPVSASSVKKKNQK